MGLARVYLIFTPALCLPRDPWVVLESLVEFVDVIQVRPKAPDRGRDPAAGGRGQVTHAAELYEACVATLAVVARSRRCVPVIANDRVDVAAALLEQGLAGVHLGQDDFPVELARQQLGPDALIGLSTHDAAQVAAAQIERVDYLGFGPFRATATKGYGRGLGAEACRVASEASSLPVFPIGGIELWNVGELEGVGRAAIGSAILGAESPARAARAFRELLA